MPDETLRLLASLPAAVIATIVAVRWLFSLQGHVASRFEHLLQALKADVADNERTIERLEAQLSTERDARRADNHRCDEQIAELRARLAQITPPHGNPPTL